MPVETSAGIELGMRPAPPPPTLRPSWPDVAARKAAGESPRATPLSRSSSTGSLHAALAESGPAPGPLATLRGIIDRWAGRIGGSAPSILCTRIFDDCCDRETRRAQLRAGLVQVHSDQQSTIGGPTFEAFAADALTELLLCLGDTPVGGVDAADRLQPLDAVEPGAREREARANGRGRSNSRGDARGRILTLARQVATSFDRSTPPLPANALMTQSLENLASRSQSAMPGGASTGLFEVLGVDDATAAATAEWLKDPAHVSAAAAAATLALAGAALPMSLSGTSLPALIRADLAMQRHHQKTPACGNVQDAFDDVATHPQHPAAPGTRPGYNSNATSTDTQLLPLTLSVYALANASLAGVHVHPVGTPSTRSIDDDGDGFAARTTHNATVVDDCLDGTTELNQYVLLQPLGKGAQGEVLLAMDTEKNELRAVKAVPRPFLNSQASGKPLQAARQRQREQLEREVAIMKRCRHRSVVRLYEVIDDPVHDRMYLVMQHVAHGAVATVRRDGTVSRLIDAPQLARYARQLAAGLEYLHRRGIIHRDIKPENILVGPDDQVFLADFGTAEVFENGSPAGIEGTRGTLAFVAPELLETPSMAPAIPSSPAIRSVRELRSDESDADEPSATSRVDGGAVDVWALGVTLYALLYGRLPFFEHDARHLFDSILRRPVSFEDGRSPLRHRRASDSHLHPAGDSVMSLPNGPTDDFSTDDDDDDLFAPSPQPATVVLPTSALNDTGSDAGGPLSACAASVPSPSNVSKANSMTDLRSRWRRVLEGMLRKDPRRRWPLRRVRQALRTMVADDQLAESTRAASDRAAHAGAIASLRTRQT